ncbi:glucokinase [Pseudomonas guariconensis]|uniref:glucokinase n=1 Tax=Pseudomonas TaxID=286 RepID=UPI001CE3F368|nr:MULTISPECIES: glucokinase [Pseudomonas]MCO7638037.1 glucokinase [Pseudomonas sp. S 311-6]MCO7516609.1 glucokinase [Pseudomonas putida]MCO7566267.1 glucokinase [Pseudomonas mosselii]MCO7593000.1 glucokinase [Pseudomonas guariconensis]MCO7606923.1 glucokinase [Pseudomonas guariconensis]
MKALLVGDIGGTNARFALWRDNRLHAVQVLATADYTRPEQAIEAYLAEQGIGRGALAAVCLAVAGPVDGDEFRFTNNHWRLSRRAFCQALQVERLLLLNDFSAMALGMTRLQDGEYRQVCPGEADPARPALVIGPGTGLGVGTLLRLDEQRWLALPGEGGHVDLPVGNTREAAIHQQIHRQIGHVSAETVLSGGGLVRLYQAICALDGDTPRHKTPAQITDAALGGEPRAMAVIEQFCRFLGRVAGNNVLTLGARGGVYIVGGVIPRFAELFLHSGFAASFADKGCMSGYFEGLPVWLVTAEFSGLLGAGVALQQALQD